MKVGRVGWMEKGKDGRIERMEKGKDGDDGTLDEE